MKNKVMYDVQSSSNHDTQNYYVSLCYSSCLTLFFSIIIGIMSVNSPLLEVPYQHFPTLPQAVRYCALLAIHKDVLRRS